MRTPILAVLSACALLGAAGDSFLLRNVTVHPVSGPDVAAGSVLVVDGVIAEVGAKIAAPKGVRVVDGKGLHVYPGMIDSGTELGLTEIGSIRETNDSAELGDFNPQLRAIVAVNPATEHIPVTRANGITSAITLPNGGVIAGQAGLIHLDGWTWEDMEVRRSAAMHLRFPLLMAPAGRFAGMATGMPRVSYAEAKRNYDRKLMELREFFEKARRYQTAKAAAAPDFRTDLKFEAMLPVLERKEPVMITAARERAIRDALEFADKQKIRVVLADPVQADRFAAELKKREIPVILGPALALPPEEDDPYDKAFTEAGELYKAGVKIAFGTFKTSASRNLPYQAATAVAFGLPKEEALKAVTLNPAEIWGAGDKLGSIEKGKWADLMVTDGDPLETRTQIKQLYIKGKPVDLENRHHKLYEKYLARP